MDSLESKKALNFDLNDSLLRKYYLQKIIKKDGVILKSILLIMDLNIDNIQVMFLSILFQWLK